MSLDAERFVNFSKMRQIRFDNEKRYRNIRREVVTSVIPKKDDEEEEDEKDEEDEEEEEKVKKLTKQMSDGAIEEVFF